MSLIDGWLPVVVRVAAVTLLLVVLLRRPRRWLVRWFPVVTIGGVLTAVAAQWYFTTLGVASEPAPWQLWVWVAATVAAALTAVGTWRSTGWVRRNTAVCTASLCLLSLGLTVNGWIGYFPTVAVAYAHLTSETPAAEVDWETAVDMRRRSARPQSGVLVSIDTGTAASGFEHRREYVYLPPGWFTGEVELPVVMMIGGEFTTPADWIRLGNAVHTLDAYATEHGGRGPVAVFVDSTGSFGNDTECVNGPRGNAADHLTGDVMPSVATQFGVAPTGWGVVGFSAGGTCAVDLAVMRPELFRAFVDITGDVGPNAGTREQTIDRLYGGDARAWARFDPATVIAAHGRYRHLAGRFVVPDPGTDGYGRAAATLCDLGTAHGIDCTVATRPGRHTWPFAADAFADAMPWLGDALSTR
jgi:S-formylglutathione hydrolase FrmB